MAFLHSEANILAKLSNSHFMIFSQYFKFLSYFFLLSPVCLLLLVTFIFISCPFCLPEFLHIVGRQTQHPSPLSHYSFPLQFPEIKLRNVPEVHRLVKSVATLQSIVLFLLHWKQVRSPSSNAFLLWHLADVALPHHLTFLSPSLVLLPGSAPLELTPVPKTHCTLLWTAHLSTACMNTFLNCFMAANFCIQQTFLNPYSASLPYWMSTTYMRNKNSCFVLHPKEK